MEENSGRPSVVSNEPIKKIDEKDHKNWQLTISELSELSPQISQTVLYDFDTENLPYQKLCAQWVQKVKKCFKESQNTTSQALL